MAFLWLKAFSQRKKGKTFTNLCSFCCPKSSRRQSIGKDVVGFKFVCEKMCSGCCFPEDVFFSLLTDRTKKAWKPGDETSSAHAFLGKYCGKF